ncbi:MAG TPA: hypothetical protein VE176_15580 [Candidatus Limnocylindrales bacterium]|nr:hypothetical protein [Candidatus Limnocylindrales bacterium]
MTIGSISPADDRLRTKVILQHKRGAFPFEVNDSQVLLKDYLSWYLLSAKGVVSIFSLGLTPQECKSNHDKR